MIEKTKKYEMFKFRDDNRAKIDLKHVEKLKESIIKCNMLDLEPILVNENMEIMDGQHRFLAAKNLNIEIHYKICENLSKEKLILLNTRKNWTYDDYIHFYAKNGNKNYIKLQNYIKNSELKSYVAIRLLIGKSGNEIKLLKEGKYIYKEKNEEKIPICWAIINYIKQQNGSSRTVFLMSSKFWAALIKLINYQDFKLEVFNKNLERMVNRITSRVNSEDNFECLLDIYNWRNTNKIDY